MNEHARSYLFVPGNRPDRFDKALLSAADVVVIDLEDAVGISAKAEARRLVGEWAAQRDAQVLDRIALRVNGTSSPWLAEDLVVLRASRIRTVMLPKAEHAQDVARVSDACPDARLLPLVESALGLEHCGQVAAAPGVCRLAFGTIDFAVDLDLDIDDDPQPLAQAAARIVLASRLAGLAAPIAGVTPQLQDEARLAADWSWFLRRGYGAKLCIHPRQVDPVHAALAPDVASLEWARRVVAADSDGQGAVSVDGRMVDRPVVLQARRVLRRAGL